MSFPSGASNLTPGRVRMTDLPSHEGSAVASSTGRANNRNGPVTHLKVMTTPPGYTRMASPELFSPGTIFHRSLPAGCRGDLLRREFARVAFRRAARQRCEHDADGFARGVGPAERARRAGVAEGLLRTSGAARLLADAEPQPARRESLRVVVPDHQPRRLGLHDLAAGPQELAQEPGE